MFGGLLIGVGFYAFVDKWQMTGSVRVENIYDIILNISLVMIIAGAVVFIVSFAGCVGALRENSCLLEFVSSLNFKNRSFFQILYIFLLLSAQHLLNFFLKFFVC